MDPNGYELTERDYREMALQSFRCKLPLHIPVLMGLALTAFNVLFYHDGLAGLTASFIFSQGVIGFAIAFLACGAILLLNLVTATMSFRAVSHLKSATHLYWNDEGIGFKSKHSNGFYPWQVAREWMETRSLVVIYLSLTMPFVIAKRAFDDGEIDAIKEHLKAANIREIRPRLF